MPRTGCVLFLQQLVCPRAEVACHQKSARIIVRTGDLDVLDSVAQVA
jgi:hypothetical protein